MATDWRFIGAVEVDSGTLVIGDPCYLLPDARNERPGVDAQALYRTGSPDAAVPIVRDLALLLQRFGGDGQNITLLALVTPNFLGRHAGLFQRHLAQIEACALACAVHQFGEGIGDAAGTHVVNCQNRVLRTQAPAVVDHLLRTTLDFRVASLHGVKVQRCRVGARRHG